MSQHIIAVNADFEMVTRPMSEVRDYVAIHPSYSLVEDKWSTYLHVHENDTCIGIYELVENMVTDQLLGLVRRGSSPASLADEVLCELLEAETCLFEGSEEYWEVMSDDEEDYEEVA